MSFEGVLCRKIVAALYYGLSGRPKYVINGLYDDLLESTKKHKHNKNKVVIW